MQRIGLPETAGIRRPSFKLMKRALLTRLMTLQMTRRPETCTAGSPAAGRAATVAREAVQDTDRAAEAARARANTVVHRVAAHQAHPAAQARKAALTQLPHPAAAALQIAQHPTAQVRAAARQTAQQAAHHPIQHPAALRLQPSRLQAL